MDVLLDTNFWLRSLLSGGGSSAGSTWCADKNVTYAHRVDNPEGWNWCLVPDGGFDAVFFAGLAITVMCMASPRWDALIVLFFGGIYFTFSYYWNLEHVSNAVMLWLGMRPADIFVFVFLPPFLLDLSVRIDFFMLKKVAFNIAFMAFVMVAASALILIPFMLYALDLKSSGWSAAHVALFGSMIASTDAASVSAVLRSGGGPEILSVLLEGESLFNDASSLTLFEIFKEVVLESASTTLAQDLRGIVVKTIWSAFTGICIGLAMGIFTRWIYAWLQYRNMEAMSEVAWSVAGAYLSFYITQVWCTGSGCIGAVAFGLYGSSTMLWGMSTKARLTGIFNQFWSVMTFIINGLIFFYVGASSVNFTIRSAQSLYMDTGGVQLVKILLYKLPLIFLASFALRFILIFFSFKFLQVARLSEGLSIQEVIFVTVGGLRGSLSLVLAQSAATLASSHEEDRRVKAEIAIYTAGYVIMTLLINAPLCGPLLTLLGLDKVRQEQLAMRGEVKNLFRKFTSTAIEDLAAGQDEDELLQGLDWAMLKLHTDFDKQLDKELPETQPRVVWFVAGWLRFFRAPGRLWGYLLACFRGRCIPDQLELDKSEEALSRQRQEERDLKRQEQDLKRATNFNIRELQLRAPGATSLPFFSAAAVRPPTALIIRDQAASSGTMGGNGAGRSTGTGLTTAPSFPTAANGTRRAPAANSLRRSGSHRLSTLVVTPPGVGNLGVGSGDREPSVHGGGRGFNRSSSRFLEGAVAGPALNRGPSLQRHSPSSPPNFDSPALSHAASGKPLDGAAATTAAGDIAVEEGPQIGVLLSPPLVSRQPQQREEQQQEQRRPQQEPEAAGGEGEEGGLLDSELMALAKAQEGGVAVERSARFAVAAAAAAVPQGSASANASRLAMASTPSGGDSMIDAALAAAALTPATSAEAAVTALPPPVEPQPAELAPQRRGSGQLPVLAPTSSAPAPSSSVAFAVRLSAPSSPRGSGGVGRPSPLSRGTVGSGGIGSAGGDGNGNGPPSAPMSRLHASTSMPKLNNLDQPPKDAVGRCSVAGSGAVAAAGEGAAAGTVSDPEPPARGRPAAAAAATEAARASERGLLQSVLVIKPGAGVRGSALASASLAPSSSVRLVQRLGDEGGRGSALEAMRTDTLVGPGGRSLGRGSVRLGAAQQQQPELSQPQNAESQEVSMPSWPATDRPLGRTSASAPNAGRPLGRSSGAFAPKLEDIRSAGSEPPSLGPFEFALPEDMPCNGSIANPFYGAAGQIAAIAAAGGGEGGALGRASVRAGGPADGGLGRSSTRAGPPAGPADGGGLARSSVRHPGGAAGGALGRASVRLGRQAGLAAVSTQLARIYDAEGGAAFDGGHQAISRPSPSLEPPPPRASIAFDHRHSLAGSAAAPLPPSASAAPSPGVGPGGYAMGPSPSDHITLQVQRLQQKQLGSQSQGQQGSGGGGGGALQHQQYSLGSNSKGVLMSLIRRSASHARSYTSGSGIAGGGGGGGVRDLSGRGSEYTNLARRTRFADGNTAAALARASASGALRQQSSEADVASAGIADPLLVEYRLRLLTGLKQYYRQKHAAGSLSPSAYKVLSYVADQSAHHPENPLSLWTMAKREVSSGPLMEAEVALYFMLKQWTAAAKSHRMALFKIVVPRVLAPFVRLISGHTAAATLRGLETAVELWASLTQSLQTEWLQYSGVYGERLLDEVQHEADGAWDYIIERRIESPKKFGAVQTHRAVIDVLTQQQAFVREMNEGGMIEESECRKIVEMVERRLQLLARRGPRWRQPTVNEILVGTAVLRGASPRVVEWIRNNSVFKVYPQGAAIWDMGRKLAGAEPDGLIIVIRGVVRMMLQQEDALVPYYLGAGGVGGLVSCVLEEHVPGMSSAAAYAEGNALGKGPLVMHVPWSVLQVLRRFSREERLAPYQALDLQLFRTAAVYVLDLLRQQVTQQFSAFIRSSLLTILTSPRLDGPSVKRQRIRLLLQPAAADNIVDGAIDWISELLSLEPEVAQLLLENGATPPAAVYHHNTSGHTHGHALNHSHAHSGGASGHGHGHHIRSHGSGAGAGAGGSQQAVAAQPPTPAPMLVVQRLAAAAWVEVMYKAIAAATGAVLDIIRSSLKDSVLVVLGPGQGIVQRTTMVLIQGSLDPEPIAEADGTGGAAGCGGPFVASSNESHVAPSVMVWVSDLFEGELVAQRELRAVAGPRGATLLIWGINPEDLLLPSPKAEPIGGASPAPPTLPAAPSAPGGADSAGAAAPAPLLLIPSAPAALTGSRAEQLPEGGKGSGGILSVARSVAMRTRQQDGAMKRKLETGGGAAANSAAAVGGGGGGDGGSNGVANGVGGGGGKEAAESPGKEQEEPDPKPATEPAEVNGAGGGNATSAQPVAGKAALDSSG